CMWFSICRCSLSVSSYHYPTLYLSPPSHFFFIITPPPPTSTLFPYTTLFRSHPARPAVSRRARLARGRTVASTFGRARCRANLRSEEHTSELQSLTNLVCRLLLEKKKIII